VNVEGSRNLLQAAKSAGVKSLVFISTLSAFEGCRSMYGKAKLEIERIAEQNGACVVRPGLVYSDKPGGMFGRLVDQVRRAKVLPKFTGGTQNQYLVHAEDLGALVLACAEERISCPAEPITIANEKPWDLSTILDTIASAMDKKIKFVPVPWRMAWMGLKTAETAGLRLGFRSDSLVSMVYQNPTPSFALQKQLGFSCREFKVTREMVAQ
jgi:nucleoside-diphosphate-sugar epimerase